MACEIDFSLNKSLKTGLFFSEGAFLHFQNFKAPSGSRNLLVLARAI